MALSTASHSSYPRIGDRPGEQKLRRAFDQLDRGEITEEGLEEILQEVIREIVVEQERAGCDLVTDGQVRWYDPVSHLMRRFKGVKIGGLLRFFDTNFYFRTPVVEKKIERKNSLIRDEVAKAAAGTKRPFKTVLTGPLTLAALSDIRGGEYKKTEDLAADLADALAEEVRALAGLGVAWIQIDEPIVTRRPELWPVLAKACRSFAGAKGKSRLALATYFGDATPIYEKLLELPVDGLVLDCCYGPGLLPKVAKGTGEKAIGLGVIDGRSTRLEKVEEVARSTRKAVEGCQSDTHLTTSCGLEYLPRARAFEKLTLLARLKEALS